MMMQKQSIWVSDMDGLTCRTRHEQVSGLAEVLADSLMCWLISSLVITCVHAGYTQSDINFIKFQHLGECILSLDGLGCV